MKKIKVYLPFTKAVVMTNYFAYKSRFVLWAMSNCVSLLANVYLWMAIYSNSISSIVGGFDVEEMIQYIFISKCVESVSFVSVEKQVSQDVRTGTISNSFIKPINYRIELLFRSFGQVIGSGMIFLPLYLVLLFGFNKLYNFHLTFNVLFFVEGVTFLIIAFLLNYLMSIIAASVVIKAIRYGGIYEVKKTVISFLSGALFPLTILPNSLIRIFNFLPFMCLRYIPTLAFLGKLEFVEFFKYLLIGTVWVIILYLLSIVLWNKQIKEVEVFGG